MTEHPLTIRINSTTRTGFGGGIRAHTPLFRERNGLLVIKGGMEMIPFNELHKQNHELTELAQVLSRLINERAMCDTQVTCELFQRFAGRFKDHLDLEDKTLYSNLLLAKDRESNSTALRSLNSSKELKRIFTGYMNRWCRHGRLHIKDHEAFVSETQDIFGFVLDRIQDETETLFPLARDIEASRGAATM